MGRAPCCDKGRVKKGPWSGEEDRKLKEYMEKHHHHILDGHGHGHGNSLNWIALPAKAGLKRCGKSCRLRWLNYLRPNIKHGDFTADEDTLICNLVATIGTRWSIIAAQLPGRTDNDIKNYWNTKLKKKLMLMGPAAAAPTQTHSSSPSTHHQQQHLFFPDPAPPLLGDAAGATAAAIDHFFSLQLRHHLAHHQYSTSTCPQLQLVSGAANSASVLFGAGDGDQGLQQSSGSAVPAELGNTSTNANANAGVGFALESFIFGGFDLDANAMQIQMQMQMQKNNTMSASLLLDQEYMTTTSCDNDDNAAAASSCVYEHAEMKPFLFVPSPSVTSARDSAAAASSQGRFDSYIEYAN